ncbi:hypothetical protein GUY40_01065 [Pseudomonas sp. R5(2019)]|nr:hypothetical protein [Pseudomonas sp. R5(2019)]
MLPFVPKSYWHAQMGAPGNPATRTYDYKRHGTTSLFAALDPRYSIHFTPTSTSWLNPVERCVEGPRRIELGFSPEGTGQKLVLRTIDAAASRFKS